MATTVITVVHLQLKVAQLGCGHEGIVLVWSRFLDKRVQLRLFHSLALVFLRNLLFSLVRIGFVLEVRDTDTQQANCDKRVKVRIESYRYHRRKSNRTLRVLFVLGFLVERLLQQRFRNIRDHHAIIRVKRYALAAIVNFVGGPLYLHRDCPPLNRDNDHVTGIETQYDKP